MHLDSSAVDSWLPDFLIPFPIPVSHTPASFCLLLPSRPITAAAVSQLAQLRRLTSDWCVSAEVVFFSTRPLHLIPMHETPFSVSSWGVKTRTCLRVLLWRSKDTPLSAQTSCLFSPSSYKQLLWGTGTVTTGNIHVFSVSAVLPAKVIIFKSCPLFHLNIFFSFIYLFSQGLLT